MPILVTAVAPRSPQEVTWQRELNEFCRRDAVTPAHWQTGRRVQPLSVAKQAQETRQTHQTQRWGNRPGEQATLQDKIACGITSIKRAYTNIDPWQVARLAAPLKRDIHRLRIVMLAADSQAELPTRQSQWRRASTQAPKSKMVGSAEATLAWVSDLDRWMERRQLSAGPLLQQWGKNLQASPQSALQRAEEMAQADRLLSQASEDGVGGYVQELRNTVRNALGSSETDQQLDLLETLVRKLRVGMRARGLHAADLPPLRAQYRLAGGFVWENDAKWLADARAWASR